MLGPTVGKGSAIRILHWQFLWGKRVTLRKAKMGAPFKHTMKVMKAMQIMNKVPAKLRNELQHGAKGLFLLIAILSDAGAASVNFLNLYSRWN